MALRGLRIITPLKGILVEIVISLIGGVRRYHRIPSAHKCSYELYLFVWIECGIVLLM